MEVEAAEDWEKQSQARLADTSTSLPMEAYTGVYRSVINGDVTIALDEGEMSLNTVNNHYTVSHWHLDTFEIMHKDWPRGMLMQFNLGADGKLASLGLGEDIFVRLPD